MASGQPPVDPGAVYLLTDYGRADELVGVVHAVLRHGAPGAPVVDLTHEIAPFGVAAGARALERAAPHLGAGVVLAVVDPGVGGPRRPVAVEVGTVSGPRFWVGPDNGLLLAGAGVLGGAVAAVVLRRSPAASRAPHSVTFDGRDLFAPAAAALWAGCTLLDVGDAVDTATLVRLAEPVDVLERAPDGRHVLTTEVTWVDRFGNAQLAAPGARLPLAARRAEVEVLSGARGDPARPDHPARPVGPARRVRTFGDLSPGELGMIEDANGHLALVLAESSAADELGLGEGDLVRVRLVPSPA